MDKLTIQDIADITGKSKSTIHRYIKKGKLLASLVLKDGMKNYEIDKSELERFLGHTVEWPVKSAVEMLKDKPVIQEVQFGEFLTKETFLEIIAEKEEKYLKPLEENAFYTVGLLRKENDSLNEELETFRRENFLLRERMKYLLEPEETETLKRSVKMLEEENRNLKEKLSLVPCKPESLSEILLDNAKNLSILQREVLKMEQDNLVFQQLREEIEKEKEELLLKLRKEQQEKSELMAALDVVEKEKTEVIEEQKNSVEESKKPWWKPFG